MESFLIWLEQTSLSIWVRGEVPGSTMVFPITICLHALGMGFLVGIALAVNARILGLLPQVPLPLLRRFLPVAFSGLAVNVVSGLLLLTGYPTKALTNPLFYLKMGALALALWGLLWADRHVLRPAGLDGTVVSGRARGIVLGASLLWLTAIVAGRLLAYTYTQLMSR